jgi:hypothetical protein
MQLTKIDPVDFVFNNDAVSTSCWRDANGNPIGSPSSTPSFSEDIFPDGVTFNCYIGTPANIQFGVSNVNKAFPSSFTTRKNYGAIRNIVYGDKNAIFEWGGSEKTSFVVVSISKNNYISLQPGSLRMGVLTDNSNMNPPEILNCGRVYKLVEASTTSPLFSFGYGTTERGLFLPDVGLILVENSFYTRNPFTLSTLNPTPTQHVFIRARNTQYNYSMNPSFISGSSGQIINQNWYNNPQTYITTVGLYNDNNELIATAKLPKPYNKNFNNELLIQVGLNF